MKIMKNESAKLNKPVVAELRESFFKNDKTYRDYFVGTITYTAGDYKCDPTDADDAYTEEEKQAILENILNEEVDLYGRTEDGKPLKKTRADSDFLEAYSEMRGNMYGGLVIVDTTAHDKVIANLGKEHEATPEPGKNIIASKAKKIAT